MMEDLYSRYLLADRLNKVAEKAGVEVQIVTLGTGDADWAPHVSFQVGLKSDYSTAGNEKAAVLLLEAMPELRLERSSGLIYLRGETYLGLKFSFYAGSGVCERVQVGSRTVPAIPEHEEPIYEVVCADPLRELVDA